MHQKSNLFHGIEGGLLIYIKFNIVGTNIAFKRSDLNRVAMPLHGKKLDKPLGRW